MTSKLNRVNGSLLAIVAEGFLSRLSFGLISFGLPLYARHLGLSLTEVGFLASLNLMVALAFKPVMGRLADRFGLKPGLEVAIGLRSLVSLLLAFAWMPWQLFAIRTIHGLSISLRDPSVNALIAEHGGKKTIASTFAWYQTAKSVAGSLGRTGAGVLLTLTASNFSLIFLVAFLLSAVPAYVVRRYVREVRKEEARAVRSERGDQMHADAGPARPSTLRFSILGFLVSGTAYMIGSLFPILATEYAGLTEAEAGLVYMISTLFILSGPAFGWLSDHISHKLVLLLRSGANTLSSLVYILAPSFPGVLVGRVLDDVGKAAFRPAWGALMAHVSGFDRRRRAQTMASLSAGEDAGEIAGPIIAGFLWSAWGVVVLLSARIALAIVTEIYAVILTGSLDRLDVPRPPRGREVEA